MVKILVVDGMGGGMGKSIIEYILNLDIKCEVFAAGTNSAASSSMLRAGAKYCATGENAIKYNAKQADIIIGPLGIVFANSMHGEISVKMAKAISKSKAHKLLIPVSRCNATILGVEEKPLSEHFKDLESTLVKIIGEISGDSGLSRK